MTKKEKKAKYMKEYAQTNKERVRTWAKDWYKKNKEKKKAQTKENQKKYTPQKVKYNKEYQKEYRTKNKVKISTQKKEYYQTNIEKIIGYRKKNKEEIIKKQVKYIVNRRLTNPLFKLKQDISNLIRISMKRKGYTKRSRTHQILGCDYDFFKQYIEAQFTNGMSWENQGKWHYDHIIPISSANTEDEIIRLNHYTNFQPMWAKDNLSKGAKIITKQLVCV